MDLNHLKQRLEVLNLSLNAKNQQLLMGRIKSLAEAFPFNKYEYMLMFLLDRKAITFKQYEKLRKDYVSSNRYRNFFEYAPRIFGEMWHQHIMDLDSRFKKPDKNLDQDYDGQYDLWINGVRVEVKSCRAINTKKKGSLVSKALQYKSDEPFWMNFQQIKVEMADVFIFIGIWIDKMVYWVMSSKEVKENKYYSPQHRGGIEYQIGITHKNIFEFDVYRVEPHKLGKIVLKKGKRE